MPDFTPFHLAFDPALPEAQRTLPAGELVAALRGGRPVRLEGTVVAGEVDLDALSYPHKLVIHNSVFTGHLQLTEARFLAGLTGIVRQRR